MKRLAHIWICVALAQCQPVPAAEPDIVDGKPIIRLTVEEARACMADGVCLLLTRAQLAALQAEAYRAALVEAQRSAKQCGRDV